MNKTIREYQVVMCTAVDGVTYYDIDLRGDQNRGVLNPKLSGIKTLRKL